MKFKNFTFLQKFIVCYVAFFVFMMGLCSAIKISTVLETSKLTIVTEEECPELFKDEIAYFDETYGKEIIFRFHPDENLSMPNKETDECVYDEKAYKEDIDKLFVELDETLSLYTEEALASFPKTIIITSLIKKGEDMVALGYASHEGLETIAICFCSGLYRYTDTATGTINHELFHVVTNKWAPEEIEEFYKIEGTCSSISDYACSDEYEELSETWAYSFDNDDNLRANYLRENYGTILKG